ncbi:MAG: hypothetical protein ACAH83_16310 [Alphaproteobacteria bacterium]
MTYSSITSVRDDTPDDLFVTRRKPVSLRKIFGKVAACIAVAATMAFYALGFNISAAYYNQWQDNKAAVTQTWDAHAQHDRTENLPWLAAGGAMVLSYSAGFSALALAKRKRSSSYGGGSGYYDSGYRGNDNFWLGYWMGNSGGRSSSSSSSSSSKDNGGAAAAIVIIGAAAIAAGASVVSYKAVKENFFGEPDPEEVEKPVKAPRPTFSPP